MKVGVIGGFQNPHEWRIPWNDLYSRTLDFVQFAEQVGLDQFWLTEHHFASDGYSPAVLPLAAAIAERTNRIRIGTKAMLLPFHNPIIVAEAIATVDILSGGRIDPGFAAGYRVEEFSGFGISPSHRAGLMEEGIRILKLALAGDSFSFHGRFWSIDNAQILPPPIQQPVPLWMGARTVKGIQRAARLGCHFQFSDFTVARAMQDWRIYRDALLDNGRDPNDYRAVGVCTLYVDEDPERAWYDAAPHLMYQQNLYRSWFQAAGDRPEDAIDYAPLRDMSELRSPDFLVGEPSVVLERIRAFHKQVPFTDFSFWTLLPGMDHRKAMRSLELIAKEVLPGIRALRSEASSEAK